MDEKIIWCYFDEKDEMYHVKDYDEKVEEVGIPEKFLREQGVIDIMKARAQAHGYELKEETNA